jgi:uncharacterized membrane protein
MLISARVGLRDPSLTYGAALLLGLGLLSLAGFKRLDLLAPVGLACTVALEYSWHAQHFVAASAGRPLTWNVGFAAVYFVFPFLLKGRYYRDAWPWAVAALAAALHFPLVHHVMKAGFPNEYMGLVPAAFAAPCGAALAFLVRAIPTASPARPAILAWFGGVMLWFVTLIFPVQFEREWITLGWALEGVALLWLYRRIPHPGVRATGFVLLLIAFARLGLNPGVFEYHPRSGVILNWFLYVYGVVSACLMAGAWLLAPPRHRTLNVNAPPILYTLGAVLAFLLLNIEIADYFSTGSRIEFQFHGNFGRDMTYSIGWAVFALVLLSVGVAWRLKAPRYAALALLGVTVVKLFFHDLVHLRQEYRIGAFLGVAVISILASVFYQRYFAAEARRDAAVEDGPVP